MSRSAHAQSDYKLRELPKCSRCNQQFQLVTASYEIESGKKILVEEWECQRCPKIVPFEYLKEGKPTEDEKFFHRKVKEIQEDARKNKERDRQYAMRNNLTKQNQ